MSESEIINLNVSGMHDFGGLHPVEYADKKGIKYVCVIAQSVFDSFWLLGCSNVPEPLPEGFKKIESGYEPYLNHVVPDKKEEFIQAMKDSTIKKSPIGELYTKSRL